jgi:hypothetical protein
MWLSGCSQLRQEDRMGRQDVRQALMAMEADDVVRERLAAGDFGAVEGLDLSADEQTLVRDAASDMPDVAGFASDIFAKIGDIKGESLDDKHKDWISVLDISRSPLTWQNAVKYGWKI